MGWRDTRCMQRGWPRRQQQSASAAGPPRRTEPGRARPQWAGASSCRHTAHRPRSCGTCRSCASCRTGWRRAVHDAAVDEHERACWQGTRPRTTRRARPTCPHWARRRGRARTSCRHQRRARSATRHGPSCASRGGRTGVSTKARTDGTDGADVAAAAHRAMQHGQGVHVEERRVAARIRSAVFC